MAMAGEDRRKKAVAAGLLAALAGAGIGAYLYFSRKAAATTAQTSAETSGEVSGEAVIKVVIR